MKANRKKCGLYRSKSPQIQTEEAYQNTIPQWCQYQTVKEHMDHLGLCWGLLGGLKGKRKENSKLIDVSDEDFCKTCEFYRPRRG